MSGYIITVANPLSRIIGHEDKKKQLEVICNAAVMRNTPIPHILLGGRAGCGKTTTARAIAEYAGARLFEASANALKSEVEVKDLLMRLSAENYDRKGNVQGKLTQQIVFIDEAHRISAKAQETLGIAMEERRIVDDDEGLTYWTPFFTVVIATTDTGALTKPFVDRFLVDFYFDNYDDSDMSKIAEMYVKENGLTISDDALIGVVRRSRGTPRILIGYLSRLSDLAILSGTVHIDGTIVDNAFSLMHIDSEGITARDRKTMQTLSTSGPMGLDALCQAIGETKHTMLTVIEPFLIRKGFLNITPRGRRLTRTGLIYIGNERMKRVVE